MKDYLVDTNTVVYFLNESILDPNLRELMISEDLAISAITKLELLGWSKISQQESKRIQDFLHTVQIIEISNQIIDNAIAIRQATRLKSPDAIIAATSVYKSIPLITYDKDFDKVEGLQLYPINPHSQQDKTD